MTATLKQRQRKQAQWRQAQAIPTDDVAIEVWAALLAAQHDGLSLPEMAIQMPELTMAQLRAGIARINHVLQQTREQPLIGRAIRGRSYVYVLPEQVGEYQTFAFRRMREVLTRAQTEVARAEAAILRWPNDVAPYVPKNLRRVEEDLQEIVDDLQEAMHDEG